MRQKHKNHLTKRKKGDKIYNDYIIHHKNLIFNCFLNDNKKFFFGHIILCIIRTERI